MISSFLCPVRCLINVDDVYRNSDVTLVGDLYLIFELIDSALVYCSG